MADKTKELTLDAIKFPEIPQGTLEEAALFELTAGAYRGLRSFYERLPRALTGDAQLIARLLGGDWRLLSAPVEKTLVAGGKQEAQVDVKKVKACPSNADIDRAVKLLKTLPPAEVLACIERVVTQCLVCTQLVPLGLISTPVRAIFVQCVDAEDQHLAQIAWLKSVL